MSERVIMIGAGGHAKVLIDALEKSGTTIAALADADRGLWGKKLFDLRIEGGDDWVLAQPAATTLLVNAVGSIDGASLARRRSLYEKFSRAGFRFAGIVHPSAVVSARATLSEGVQVLAGAIVQPAASIGTNTIINTGAQVDHDCEVGPHVHLAPGVVLSAAVRVGVGTHVGAGAVVIQGARIGSRCVVAAGAVVVQDVPDEGRVAGVPARPLGT